MTDIHGQPIGLVQMKRYPQMYSVERDLGPYNEAFDHEM